MTTEQPTGAAWSRSRERDVAETLVRLADCLVEDYDMIEQLYQLTAECVRLLPVDAAGLMLSDQRGSLQLVSSSSEQSRLLELFELQTEDGPCVDSFRTSDQVSLVDLGDALGRWPLFAARTAEAGYAAVHALPLRLRADTIGALSLFTTQPGKLHAERLRVGQALADLATITILQQRALHRNAVAAEQLQATLNSRVIIEQAKGVLAERHHIDMADAFDLLRRLAHDSNRKLTDIAAATATTKPSQPPSTPSQTTAI